MSRLIEKDIVEYVRSKTSLFEKTAELMITELSDGNINYVYRVQDEKGKSVIVKYADDKIRTSGNPLTVDRNRIETNALLMERELAGNYVPEVYLLDQENRLFIMEDLKDHENMRYGLMQQHTYSTFAKDITDFMVRTLILSTDDVILPLEKKELVKKFINPMLCRITERLVFSEPYDRSCPFNNYTPELRDYIVQEICNDTELKLEVAKLKNTFKNKAQSLLHGDLHTGSIFVKEGSTKMLDPEFAFYGPAGYDVGNVIANLTFALIRNCFTAKDVNFDKWVRETIEYITNNFQMEGRELLADRTTDPMADVKGYVDYVIDDIMNDSIGMTGTELIRRTVGDAQVKDLTTIEKPARLMAEKCCIILGKEFIKNRNSYRTGKAVTDKICEVIREVNA